MNMGSKQVVMINATSKTNGHTATGRVDTRGFDFCKIDVVMGTSDSTSNNPSVFKIGAGDTTSAYTDITALVGDGTGGWTVPAADTSNVNQYQFNIDLRGVKRWLLLTISPTTTQIIDATANLFRGDETPYDATTANVDALVEA